MSELIVNTISGLSDLSVGNTTVNTTVNSTSFSTGDTNITGDTLSVGNTTVNSTVNSTSISIGSNNLTVGTSAYFVSNGNVGIGTSSPPTKLKVVASGPAIQGDSTSSYGVYGTSNSNYGVYGTSTSSYGVYGVSSSNFGVRGDSTSGTGVYGTSGSSIAVRGISTSSVGVYGTSSGANQGGYFQSSGNYGVYGRTLSSSHGGVLGYNYNATKYGIVGHGTAYSFYGNGALSKASGSFRIPHPLPELKDTHDLVHSFVESPTADNIYRGKIQLQNGQATVNIDTHSGMTEGTFAALNGNVQVFLQNDSGWDLVRGSVSDNILTIISQNQQSSDTISWLVIAERQDEHMLETGWTDEFGRPTLEPLKMPDPILPEQEEV